MIFIILGLIFSFALLSAGFTIAGALLSAFLWLCVQLPVGIICIVLGMVLYFTILLFPIGKFFCKLGVNIIIG